MGSVCSHATTKTNPILPESTPYFDGYVFDSHPTEEEVILGNETWSTLLSGDSPEIKALSSSTNSSPVTLFYDAFYHHLFLKAPETKVFWTGGIAEKAHSLINMVLMALKSVRTPNELQKFAGVARAHGFKGIDANHFAAVINALIYALEKLLGEKFSVKHKLAWCSIYSYVCDIMMPIAHVSANSKEKPAPSAPAPSSAASPPCSPRSPREIFVSGLDTARGE